MPAIVRTFMTRIESHLRGAAQRTEVHRRPRGLVLPAIRHIGAFLIGRVMFAPRYGSSVHAAAALAIARRAMALSERLPASGGTITLPRPARIARKHAWSSWSQLSAGLSAVHAGHREGAPFGAIGRRERSTDLRRRRDGDRLTPPLLRLGVRFLRASGALSLAPRLPDRLHSRRGWTDFTWKKPVCWIVILLRLDVSSVPMLPTSSRT